MLSELSLLNQFDSLLSSELNNSGLCSCGANHLPQDHQLAAIGMPEDPIDLIGDLVQMGHYSGASIDFAKSLTQAEFKQALLLQMIDRAEPSQKAICEQLIKLAGGVEEAFGAAFGPNANEFFTDGYRVGAFNRRDFLIKVAASAAVVTLASCGGNQAKSPTESAPSGSATTGKLEKTDLTIGFIPIACSIPIVLAEPQGIYKKYGLNVTLKKMPNWAAVRESAIAGELDAYHMLSPMPIAMTLGLGSNAFPIKLASIENINGQSIAVASKHLGKVKEAKDFKGMTIGIPFPFSMHNLLIRYYLAAGGLNPDKDVTIQIVPPPDSVAKMAAGQIDAFLMPDNFGQRAIFEKIGFIHLLTKDLWPGHPCCAFAASEQWIGANPNTFRAVNKAIIDSATYVNNPANRESAAQTMSDRKYLNQPEPVLKAVLIGKFENGQGQNLEVPDRIQFEPYPWKSFAKWIASQMVVWNLMPTEKAKYQEIADQIYMTDLARELAKELGQNPPSDPIRVEKLKFGDFDPANVEAYIDGLTKQFQA
jgi:nitrate/nitrite transport system substrate-binding protein